MAQRTIEDEINPPLSSAVVTEPQAVKEEVRGEDEELAHMRISKEDLEKGGQKDVVESLASEEAQPKPPVLDFPDGGLAAWSMVFGAWWISFSTFGIFAAGGTYDRFCELFRSF